ncbi:hypothetical protein SAMN02745121_01165 [Nannocystis exedens]|uniref:Uncharacterized protein n=1 Tax=Nannocystis exedens TaxID=54 RepID=A0A1I1UDA6_9BACT|nr:hypothetical protein [Nannocystis exedens]PCC71621.1 hypothetical protein NAEX_04698 [Nannocystis exedens]SFD68822.1 hypothetical protein SAMN02745121_01165 [Nannocystis exedens]
MQRQPWAGEPARGKLGRAARVSSPRRGLAARLALRAAHLRPARARLASLPAASAPAGGGDPASTATATDASTTAEPLTSAEPTPDSTSQASGLEVPPDCGVAGGFDLDSHDAANCGGGPCAAAFAGCKAMPDPLDRCLAAWSDGSRGETCLAASDVGPV